MKYFSLLFFVLFFHLYSQAQDLTFSSNLKVTTLPQIIPNLSKIEFGNKSTQVSTAEKGEKGKNNVFEITAQTEIVYTGNDEWQQVAKQIQKMIQPATGFNLPIVRPKAPESAISIVEDPTISNPEGYKMSISEKGIEIGAKTPAGAFYAMQTLRQLLPAEIEKKEKVAGVKWQLPYCTIEDAPRFAYRGFMLDVARHFYTVDEVKQFIDILAMHKINQFHWHLSDDQGWRVEIKKYPKLTTVASCRKQTLVGPYTETNPQFDGKEVCGFYTQEQIRDVVKYAQERFINVIPEIDVPGHVSALLTAYPEYGCVSGKAYKVQETWGVFEDILCPSNGTFKMLDDIFGEISALFPGKYIHIGGDEVPKNQWIASDATQKFMKKNKLKTEQDLQAYFTSHIIKFLETKGKEAIGWDEILEGEVPQSAIIMSWQGTEGGIKAAQHGNRAIMAPFSYMYFNQYQTLNRKDEPIAFGGYLPIEKVYAYEPIPQELSNEQAKNIMGVQANLWTEYINNFQNVLYMAAPRIAALAEVQWTDKDHKNYDDFTARLLQLFKHYDALNINYAKRILDVTANIETRPSSNIVTLSSKDHSSQIYYTTDGTIPIPQSATAKLYTSPVQITETCVLRANIIRKGFPVGKEFEQAFAMHKAVGAKVKLTNEPDAKYTPQGGAQALVNGIKGSDQFGDGQWLGFAGKDFEALIELPQATLVKYLGLNFVNAKQSWIYPPKQVTFWVSEDGYNWELFYTTDRYRGEGVVNVSSSNADVEQPSPTGKTAEVAQPIKGSQSAEISKEQLIKRYETPIKYIKVRARNFGEIPDKAPGAGNPAWLFIDEVVVE